MSEAADFPLVPGARWVASVESMGRVERELVPLLARAGRRAAIVSAATQAREREEAWALPVLDLARWKEAGLDPSQGWTVFADPDGVWVSAGVVDAARVAAWIDRWARLRGLLQRDVALTASGLDTATYARAKGSRVASARIVSKGRVLVLAQSDVRGVELEKAWNRAENVIPAAAPVEGVLRGWLRRAAARDVWWSVRPQTEGVDLDVRFGGVGPGWVRLEPARAAWVTAALDGRGAAFRGRATVGPAWASVAAAELADGWRTGGAEPAWLAAFQAVATGPVELVGETVFPARAVVQDGQVAWARVFPAWFVMPDRPEELVRAFIESSRSMLGGPLRPRAGVAGVVAGKGWKGRVEAGDRATSLRIAIGDESLPAPRAGGASTPFGDGCARGHPVAAGRIDGPLLAKALDGVTLLGALRNEAVLAAWAIGSELGPLLRVSEPLTVIACAESEQVVELRLRWRYRP